AVGDRPGGLSALFRVRREKRQPNCEAYRGDHRVALADSLALGVEFPGKISGSTRRWLVERVHAEAAQYSPRLVPLRLGRASAARVKRAFSAAVAFTSIRSSALADMYGYVRTPAHGRKSLGGAA